MSKLTKALTAAAGNAGGDNLYAEDVFSTYLYDSTHGTSPIVNDINLADEGGMVWFKNRVGGYSNILFDTERGTSNHLVSNTTAANATSIGLGSFNTDGFSFSGVNLNVNSDSHVAWSFRKAEKFFDVVTWTGTGGARTLSHNLGSTPSVIIVKSTTNSAFWCVYHSSLGATKYLQLSSTVAAATASTIWNDTAPTSTEFTVGAYINQSQTYVAYLFASDAGGFGDDGDENIIKCGSFVASSTVDVEVNLGFEPQWVIAKRSDGSGSWRIYDTMRNFGNDTVNYLLADTSGAEVSNYAYDVNLRSTGFIWKAGSGVNLSNYIYIAIRRPMKTPESGTEVFAVDQASNSTAPKFRAPFPVDMAWYRLDIQGTELDIVADRLRGEKELNFSSNYSEGGLYSGKFDYMNGWNNLTGANSDSYSWMFKRATGFFDMVAYTGDGASSHAITHNLTVIPELIICKSRTASWDWATYTAPTGAGYYLKINTNSASAASAGNFPSAPTSSVFSVGTASNTNASGGAYIAYLFASLDGVSKVGSYTGTGNNLNVDCGFSSGARFILIKRTDSTGDWYYWDYERGIVAGNDPYLRLNLTAFEVTNTDYIDPLASGFTVTASASSHS